MRALARLLESRLEELSRRGATLLAQALAPAAVPEPSVRRVLRGIMAELVEAVQTQATEIAQAEAEVERRKLHDLFDLAPVAIAVLEGPGHRFTFANPAYRRLVGGRDVVGKGVLEALPEIAGQGFDALLDRVVTTGEPFVGNEVRISLDRTGTGQTEEAFLNFTYTPKRDRHGRPDGVLVSAVDVTAQVLARQRSEQLADQLRTSEEVRHRILESSGAGLWELDFATGAITADARMIELMGLPPGSTFDLASALEQQVVPEDRERVASAVTAAMAGEDGGLYLVEFRTGGRGGIPLRWVESRARVSFDAVGKARSLGGAMIDITARKAAEAEREQARAQIAGLLESMNEAVFSVSSDWRITQVNRHFERLSHLGREEVMGKVFWDVFPAVANPSTLYWQQYHRCMVERVPTEFVDHYPPLDYWTDTHTYPTADGGFIAFSRDISAQRRAEIALQASEERYRTLFDSIDEGFCLIELITDERGQTIDYLFLEANGAFEAQTGLRAPVGQTIRQLAPGISTTWFDIYGRVAATGETTRFENHDPALGRWFDAYASRVGPAERRQVAIVFKDATASKAAEQERERLLALESQARHQAEEASRLKDEFLATISHELRTPLTAMLGWVQMLRSGAVPPDRQPRALETIERNARAQAQLIEDLLDMSRILAGKLGLEFRPLELATVVEAALDSIRPTASAKGVRLQPVLDSCGTVMGDANRLQQVVWNLLTNAVKFTPRGGRVQVIVQCVESSVELTVVDTGQGIAAEFLPHVFERFRQAEGGITRAKGGLGLGLSIVRQLVELHGGTVTAFSQGEGKGALFTVRLPLSATRTGEPEASPGPSLPAPAATTAPRGELAGLRLLVVDDEQDTRDMLALLLEASGAQVRVAASAEEARRLFMAERPDVVVSDIGMPHEDGYALIAWLRSQPREAGGDVPAIALTAYARGRDRTRALQAGFQNHVAKPVDPPELFAVISSLARSRPPAP